MPLAAAVPALIGAAGAVGGGLLAGSAANNATSAGRGVLNATASNASQNANNLLGIASQGLGSTANFYSTLMSGNQQQIQQLLGPEISGIGQQYNQVAQQTAQLNPRGGSSAAAVTQLPFQKESTIGNAILSAPLTGASGLLNTSSTAGGLGTNLFNTAAGAGSALGNIGLGISGQQLQGAAGGYTLGNNLATGLNSLFSQNSSP